MGSTNRVDNTSSYFVKCKDIIKDTDYYLTFEYYGYGNTKVRLKEFCKRKDIYGDVLGSVKGVCAIMISEDGKQFVIEPTGVISNKYLLSER